MAILASSDTKFGYGRPEIGRGVFEDRRLKLPSRLSFTMALLPLGDSSRNTLQIGKSFANNGMVDGVEIFSTASQKYCASAASP